MNEVKVCEIRGEVTVENGAQVPAVGVPGEVVAGVATQAGGIHKPQGFVNSEVVFSSENTASGVHKPGEIVNEFQLDDLSDQIAKPTTISTVSSSEAEAIECEYEVIEERKLAVPKPVRLGLGGRPRILNDDLVGKLFMLVSVGFSRRQAAVYLGISPSAITNRTRYCQ
ncbi:hypothetical protein NA78x_005320 [Anatilimnocola sp. NA78]|uniref:hypothetical protein n=1 Tax=Anatilimnocola sp. NA78 TaxID=3415683 RepID=UPI003CE48112